MDQNISKILKGIFWWLPSFSLERIELMKKRSKVDKQRALFQIIYLPATWLIQ